MCVAGEREMTSTLKPCSLACGGGELEEVGRRLEHAGDVRRHPADRDVDRVLRCGLVGREAGEAEPADSEADRGERDVVERKALFILNPPLLSR